MAYEDIISTLVPPLSGFELPAIVPLFYEKLKQQQAERRHDVVGGFVFGGAIADCATGRQGEDIDVYIAAPTLLHRLLTRSEEKVYSYRDRQEQEDDLRAIIGYSFPFDIDSINLAPTRAELFGSYIVGRMQFAHKGEEAVLDVIVGQNPLSLRDFLPHVSAPIMAAGMTLGSNTPEFFHHKDYVEHVKEGLLCVDNPGMSLLEKAQKKNWTIITTDEWKQRQNKPSSSIVGTSGPAMAAA